MSSVLLPRQLPDPLPSIHPVPEYQVDGERRRFYEEMKAALQVPWMGVVTMAYAHYPTFFRVLWQGLQPVVADPSFARHGAALRAVVEGAAPALVQRNLLAPLKALGYAPREIDQIRQVLGIFAHGNHPYLLIATLVRLLLEGQDAVPDPGLALPAVEPPRALDVQAPLVLMEAHHADAPTRAIYEDIKQTLGLPFVNTDYRALARWPSYFALAWAELKPALATAAYPALCESVHREAVSRVSRQLPVPASLSAKALQEAARADAPLDEVLRVARLFQWLLPGLVTNVAVLQAQLLDAS